MKYKSRGFNAIFIIKFIKIVINCMNEQKYRKKAILHKLGSNRPKNQFPKET